MEKDDLENGLNRRRFIKQTAILSSGIALAGAACISGKAQRVTTHPFGLQLYSLRNDLPKDVKGVLKQVASFGYTQIEGYEADMGLFWGMKNTEFKKYVNDLGMDFVASHCKWQEDFEKKAAEAGEIGMKYLMCPFLGAQKSMDDFRKFAAKFNECGEICKKNGLRFAYHNHNYSFKPLDGQLPQEVMMQETDPSLVDFEMDIYWVIDAGADPEAWMKKYKERFKLCHVKDRLKNPDPKAGNNSCTLGEGSIDYAKILTTAKENGMQYYLVEQERYDNTTPLKSAEDDATYMKNLHF